MIDHVSIQVQNETLKDRVRQLEEQARQLQALVRRLEEWLVEAEAAADPLSTGWVRKGVTG